VTVASSVIVIVVKVVKVAPETLATKSSVDVSVPNVEAGPAE
jgi:hypothetical protein